MGRRAIAIALADGDGEPLEARAITAPYGRGPWRAGIPLLKADGHAAVDIADRVGLSRKSVMPRVSKAPRRPTGSGPRPTASGRTSPGRRGATSRPSPGGLECIASIPVRIAGALREPARSRAYRAGHAVAS